MAHHPPLPMLAVLGNNPLHFAYDVGEASVLAVKGGVAREREEGI